MSIGAIGALASGNLSQILASLLSRIDPSSTSTSSTAAQPADSSFSPDTGPAPSNALTGSTSAQLSGDVVGMLIGLQQQSQGATPSTAAGSSPLNQLFAAMDTNGNGTVSQSEMETYFEQRGGTQSQADTLFASLDQSGSSGISESQMGSALQQSTQAHGGGGGHHHHHGMSASSSSNAADALLQAIDSNGDGSVSQGEFTSFVTQNGGTAGEAQQDFAALDSSGSGTLSSADFSSAIQNLQSSMSNATYSPMLNLLNTLAQNATATSGTTTSITA